MATSVDTKVNSFFSGLGSGQVAKTTQPVTQPVQQTQTRPQSVASDPVSSFFSNLQPVAKAAPQPITQAPKQKSIFDTIGSFISDKLNPYVPGGVQAGIERVKKTPVTEFFLPTSKQGEPAVKYLKDTVNMAIDTVKGAGKLTAPYLVYRAATNKPVSPKEHLDTLLKAGLDAMGFSWRVQPEAPLVGSIFNTWAGVRRYLQGKIDAGDLVQYPLEGVNKQPRLGEVLTDNLKTAQVIDTVFLATMFLAPIGRKTINNLNIKSEGFLRRIEPLGIKPNSTMEEVSAAVRNKMKAHPDAFTLKPTTEGMKARTEITDALNAFKEAGILDKNYAAAYDFLTNKLGIEVPKAKEYITPKQISEKAGVPTQAEVIKPLQVEMNTSLKGSEAKAQQFATDYVTKNTSEALASYDKRVQQEYGATNIVSADVGKFAIPDFNAEKSAAYHEPASALAKLKADQLLKDPANAGKPVLFMAGGSGAGKTTIARKLDNFEKYALVYDSNTNNLKSAISKIDRVLSGGRDVTIDFVYRDPLKAFEGVIRRVKTRNRIVPVSAHIDTHIGSIETMKALKEKYGDTVKINVFDNNGSSIADVKVADLKFLDSLVYNKDELKQSLYDRLQTARANNEITTEQYNTFTGSGEGKQIARPVNTTSGQKSSTGQVNPGVTSEIPKDLQPLAQEAKKYKSAEEFIKAKSQEPLYPESSQVLSKKVPEVGSIIKTTLSDADYKVVSSVENRLTVKKVGSTAEITIGIDEVKKVLKGKMQNAKERAFNPEVMVTTELLTAKEVIPQQIAKEKPTGQITKSVGGTPTPVGTGKLRASEAYRKVRDRLDEETQVDVNYNRLNLEKDAENAMQFIADNPKDALRVALGIDAPPQGQTETAISIALADKAGRDGNFELQSQLEAARSLRQTRRGQEIVSERGRFNDNSPYHFIQELMDRRLKAIGYSAKDVIAEVSGQKTGAKKRAVEIIDKKAAKLKEHITKDQAKIQIAQDIIDALRC